jgi:MtN3 and saliva related transmembrane protein
MNAITLLGFLAGAVTTFSYLPQVIKIIKTKSVQDVSIEMAALLSFGTFLWTIYGFLSHSLPVILANILSFVFVFTILMLKVRYK